MSACTHMKCCVLFRGIKSSMSSSEASMWGAFFYLTLIDPMIKDVRNQNCGAYVVDLFSGLHEQANEVDNHRYCGSLVSTVATTVERTKLTCRKGSGEYVTCR